MEVDLKAKNIDRYEDIVHLLPERGLRVAPFIKQYPICTGSKEDDQREVDEFLDWILTRFHTIFTDMSTQATEMKNRLAELSTQRLVSDERRKVAESGLAKTERLATEVERFIAFDNERNRVLSEGQDPGFATPVF